MSPTTSHLARSHSYFITIFYDDSVLDSKTDDVKQFSVNTSGNETLKK
jgi:hypothetical protein